LLGRQTPKPAANPFNPPAQQPKLSHQLLPQQQPCRPHCRAGPACQPPHPSPFFPFSPTLCPGSRSTEPHRAGARDGSAAPARRSARRGPVRARGVGFDRGEGKDPTALTTRIQGEPGRRPRTPPAPPAERPGVRGTFPPRSACGLDSKGREAGVARTPSHQPPLGFSIRHHPCLRRLRRRRRRAATASRRAREEPGAVREQGHLPRRDAVDTPRTSPSTAARGKERRSFASEKGAGPEQGPVHRRERLLHHTTAILDPATTTPPPPT
jgi:hypothetical protein